MTNYKKEFLKKNKYKKVKLKIIKPNFKSLDIILKLFKIVIITCVFILCKEMHIFESEIAECGGKFSSDYNGKYAEYAIKRQNEKYYSESLYEDKYIRRYEYSNINSETFLNNDAFKSDFKGNGVDQQPFDDANKNNKDLEKCNEMDTKNKNILIKNLEIELKEKIIDIVANDSNNALSNNKNDEYFIYDSFKK